MAQKYSGYTPGLRDEEGRLQYVGHYGCSAADRVVKVAPPARIVGRPHHMESWRIKCPGCKVVHVVRPMWRPAKDAAELARSETVLPEETLAGEPMAVGASRGSR